MNSPDTPQNNILDRSFTIENSSSMTDEEIVGRVLKGNTDLFEVIIKRYNQQIFRIAHSYLSDEEDIKDVMQTAYLKAFEKLKQFRSEARFSTWLIRIVINEALKAINQKKHISELHSVTSAVDNDQITKAENSTPESKAIQNDMNKLLEQAVDRLPPKYRSVFIMREVEQMNVKETAQCLGITRVNVKVRLYRAKSMLREELEKTISYSNLFFFRGAQCDAMTERVMHIIKARL